MAEVPALKGCFSQGDTIEELKENIKEAIELWMTAEIDTTDGDIISIVL